jgi:hypothetical protein
MRFGKSAAIKRLCTGKAELDNFKKVIQDAGQVVLASDFFSDRNLLNVRRN